MFLTFEMWWLSSETEANTTLSINHLDTMQKDVDISTFECEDMEISCEYNEYAVAGSRQGVVLQRGVLRGANNSLP